MASAIRKRSVSLSGKKTSMSLEDPFWTYLQSVAKRRDVTVSKVVCEILESREFDTNLSSCVRLYCFKDLMSKVVEVCRA